MRLQHWIVPAIGMVVALGGSRQASAQYDPTRVVPADDPFAATAASSPFPYNDAAANGGYPVMQTGYYAPQGAPGQPMAAQPLPGNWLEPGQISNYSPPLIDPPASAAYPDPNSFHPWPEISPYDHRFQQHHRENGLWFQQTNDSQDRHYFSADVIVVRNHLSEERDIGGNGSLPFFVVANTADVFGHLDFSTGLQLRWGTLRPDGSRLELKGFYSGEMDDTERFNFFGFVGEHGLHIDSGGGEINRISTPFYDRGPMQMSSIFGMRYMGVDEELNFQVTDIFAGPFTTSMKAQTLTNLLGPQLGLYLQAGGKSAMLRAETKASLMCNWDQVHLSGNGFGDPQSPVFVNTFFESQRDHLHISPLFEQSISIEWNAFEYVPGLNRIKLLEEAKFKAGYTFIAVGEMARVASQIRYEPPPTNPFISLNRTHMVQDWFSFGLVWER